MMFRKMRISTNDLDGPVRALQKIGKQIFNPRFVKDEENTIFSEAHLSREIKQINSMTHKNVEGCNKRLSIAMEEIEIFEKEFLSHISRESDRNNNQNKKIKSKKLSTKK